MTDPLETPGALAYVSAKEAVGGALEALRPPPYQKGPSGSPAGSPWQDGGCEG